MVKSTTHKSEISKSMIKDDIIWMRRYARKSIVATTLVVWFLLFFLNILIWVANHTSKFSDTLHDKLWMYFYIVDRPWEEDAIYGKILRLQKELDAEKIHNEFVSKTEALKFLQKKMPDLISKFSEYDISNPFPATLYLKVLNEWDYDKLQQIMPNYASVISNVDDLEAGRSLYGQETRIIKTLNFSKFLVNWSYFLVILFVWIILFLLFYLFRVLINKFHSKIEVKKLLWATFEQMAWPFLGQILWILLWWFVIMFLLTFWLDLYLQTKDFSLLFFVDIFSLDIVPASITWFVLSGFWIVLGEIIFLVGVSMLVNISYIGKVIKKAGN